MVFIAKWKGKSKIGMDARKLKDGTIKKKGVAIKSPYQHKELCKKVKNKFSGKWKAKKKIWSYPLEIEVVDYATEIWDKKGLELEKSDLLKEWYEKRKIERENLLVNKDRKEVKPEELDTELADTLYDFQRIAAKFTIEVGKEKKEKDFSYCPLYNLRKEFFENALEKTIRDEPREKGTSKEKSSKGKGKESKRESNKEIERTSKDKRVEREGFKRNKESNEQARSERETLESLGREYGEVWSWIQRWEWSKTNRDSEELVEFFETFRMGKRIPNKDSQKREWLGKCSKCIQSRFCTTKRENSSGTRWPKPSKFSPTRSGQEKDKDFRKPWLDCIQVETRMNESFSGGGVILGLDMGLGKTLTSLAVTDAIKANKTLVVCPASLKYNWAEEIEKWLPNKTYTILDGSKEKRIEALENDVDFYITNYASLREKSRAKINGNWTNVDNELFLAINKKNFEVAIYDEAHKMKNRKSQQTKALYKITNGIKRNYLLTGTPIMNTPEDLWSLLHIIDRKKFSSFWRFVHRYCEVWDNGFGKEIGSAKNPKEFREMLKPYMLRRLKEEVIEDMPELTKQKSWVELEGKQSKIYHQMEEDMVAELSGQEEIKAPIIISKIMRLKQIAVSEQLLAEKPSIKKFKKSAKIKALNEIIDDSGDQKIVVFTQYQSAAKLVAKMLDKKGIGYGMIHGGVKNEERQKEVNKFQENENCKIFVATIKAGGLGLTLTAGSIAVFLDKDWTPANNTQAVDRLHRLGQEKNVTVIELLAKDSIEEYIEEMLEGKQKTFDSLIEGKITGKEILLNLRGEQSE